MSLIQSVIRIYIPDAGPLISLAKANALDSLLFVSPDVRLILSDIANYEATQQFDDFHAAKKINDFLIKNADRIQTKETFFGKLALEDLQRKKSRGESATLPKDAGEISVNSLIQSFREFNSGDPVLVLLEDVWFDVMVYSLPSNVHLLSTSAWLDGVQNIDIIPSAIKAGLV